MRAHTSFTWTHFLNVHMYPCTRTTKLDFHRIGLQVSKAITASPPTMITWTKKITLTVDVCILFKVLLNWTVKLLYITRMKFWIGGWGLYDIEKGHTYQRTESMKQPREIKAIAKKHSLEKANTMGYWWKAGLYKWCTNGLMNGTDKKTHIISVFNSQDLFSQVLQVIERGLCSYGVY